MAGDREGCLYDTSTLEYGALAASRRRALGRSGEGEEASTAREDRKQGRGSGQATLQIVGRADLREAENQPF